MAALSVTAAKIEAQQAWQIPTLLNSWVNFGGTANTVAYMKDSLGFMHLKGLAKNGTIGQAIFVLPVGYRPAAYFRSSTVSGTGPCNIDIPVTGEVTAASGGNTSYSIDNITFKAEN